jgi:hypothetical protein
MHKKKKFHVSCGSINVCCTILAAASAAKAAAAEAYVLQAHSMLSQTFSGMK